MVYTTLDFVVRVLCIASLLFSSLPAATVSAGPASRPAPQGGDPQADFAGSPLTGPTPLTVTFTDNSVNATAYLWAFGDGIANTLPSPTHIYTYDGGGTMANALDGHISMTDTASMIVRSLHRQEI